MSNYYVDRILKEKKITDFLADNGIHPAKKSGEKYLYRCPIHSGDNDPSFIVYPEGTEGREYQTYHCFGCHSGINIINLKSDLDKISIKETIRFFLTGMNIDPIEAMDSVVDSIIRDINLDHNTGTKDGDKLNGDKKIECLMLFLNTCCRRYLELCEDEEEVEFFDNIFYKKIDEIAMANDFETLKAYSDMLEDKKVLENRGYSIEKRKEDEENSSLGWLI